MRRSHNETLAWIRLFENPSVGFGSTYSNDPKSEVNQNREPLKKRPIIAPGVAMTGKSNGASSSTIEYPV